MKRRLNPKSVMTPAAKCATLSLGLTLMAALGAPPAWAGDTSVPTETGQTAQGNLVTGTVVDEQGEPLLGATVRVEVTKTATTTDVNGRFSVKASAGQTIVITYVGMKPFSAKAGAGPIDAVMTSDNALDEVVVVGYGTVRKADLAGSVSVLEGKAFEAQPITTVQEALQGRVSGVNIVSDGLPGGSTKIRIRGANSINKSNDPLYVVDGLVRESGLDGINPEDIASMQILKDASSTAIYGSRGANGVVIITTKRGHAGESKLTVDMSLGWSNATHLPEVLGTRDYAKALVDYDGIPEAEVKSYLDGSDPGTNWKDEVFKTGMVQNYKVVFTKGSEDTQLYVSGNYMSHQGVMKDTL